MAQVAANHLAGRWVKPPPSKSRADAIGDTARRSSGSDGSGIGILGCLRRVFSRLWLQGGRVDAVGVEALVDGSSLLDEVRHGLIRDDYVGGRDGLLLVQPPDVQLMD